MTTAPTPARTQTPAAPAAHTPTPWESNATQIHSENGLGIAQFGFNTGRAQGVIDAQFTAAAVNAHAGLLARVAELEAALALCETRLNVAAKQSGTRPATRAEFAGAAEIARAALAKEGGK